MMSCVVSICMCPKCNNLNLPRVPVPKPTKVHKSKKKVLDRKRKHKPSKAELDKFYNLLQSIDWNRELFDWNGDIYP